MPPKANFVPLVDENSSTRSVRSSRRQLVRPVKKSLFYFDHLAEPLQAPLRQSTIFIDQTPNRPVCKVRVQPIVTNVTQIGCL
jgi:hypothetical protein